MEKIEKSYLIQLSKFQNISIKNKDESQKEKSYNIKVRYLIFDNFKGLLIFTVVFAHFLFEYSNININSLSRKIVAYADLIIIYLFFPYAGICIHIRVFNFR